MKINISRDLAIGYYKNTSYAMEIGLSNIATKQNDLKSQKIPKVIYNFM